jgi:hypothetical protein
MGNAYTCAQTGRSPAGQGPPELSPSPVVAHGVFGARGTRIRVLKRAGLLRGRGPQSSPPHRWSGHLEPAERVYVGSNAGGAGGRPRSIWSPRNACTCAQTGRSPAGQRPQEPPPLTPWSSVGYWSIRSHTGRRSNGEAVLGAVALSHWNANAARQQSPAKPSATSPRQPSQRYHTKAAFLTILRYSVLVTSLGTPAIPQSHRVPVPQRHNTKQ